MLITKLDTSPVREGKLISASGIIIFVLFLLTVIKLPAQNGIVQRKPNIVFILADDLGRNDLSCYGNPYNETPQLDKLAKTGIRFTQAYSACPVCSPTRAAIMTGKYPARLQLTNFIAG